MFVGVSKERWGVSSAWEESGLPDKEICFAELEVGGNYVCVLSKLSYLWDLEEQRGGRRCFKVIVCGGKLQTGG